jgi:hypothetical protein
LAILIVFHIFLPAVLPLAAAARVLRLRQMILYFGQGAPPNIHAPATRYGRIKIFFSAAQWF